MKPTAPPVKRGRPGTNGERNSAISRRSVGTNGSLALGRHARALDRASVAVARAQHQERILAEKRVARDLLAAFDALEQERVVGVLGDLEERRHRRQQVGHDLLDDRHERAAPRQVDELFERRLLHLSQSLTPPCVASRNSPAGGRWPVHDSNCRSAWATSISIPPIVSQPGGARLREQRGLGWRVDEVVDDPAVERRAGHRVARQRAAADSVVALTSRSQVPAAGGHVAGGAASRRRDRRRGVRMPRRDRRPLRPRSTSATAAARAAPPAPRIVARVPFGARRAAQRLEEALDVGVRRRSSGRRATRRVLMAPTPPGQVVDLVDVPTSDRTLNGVVMLAPRRPIARAKRDEVVAVARLERDVDGVQPERREPGVVHDRRQRMRDRLADDAVERGVGRDAPELELAQQPRRPRAGRARRRRRRRSSGCRAAPRGPATPGRRCPSRSARDPGRIRAVRRRERRTAAASPRGCRRAPPASRSRRRSGAAPRRAPGRPTAPRRTDARETTMPRPPVVESGRARTRAAASTSTNSAPQAGRVSRIRRRSSSVPSNLPPSQAARQVTIAGAGGPRAPPPDRGDRRVETQLDQVGAAGGVALATDLVGRRSGDDDADLWRHTRHGYSAQHEKSPLSR